MAERRKSARFALTLPLDAQLSVLQDVVIEHAGDDEITVLSVSPGVRGEDLLLRIGPSDAVQMSVAARTVSSEPRVGEGRVTHRIRLALTGSIALSTSADTLANSWWSGDRSTAVFVRTHAARVINLSRGGCLLELSHGLETGTVATLHCGDRRASAEPIRVNCQQGRRGPARLNAAGVGFLSLRAPSSRSLRATAARLEAEHEGMPLAGAGEESGLGLTNSVNGPLDILAIVCAATRTDEPIDAPVRRAQSQSKAGSPLALVERRTTTPSAHETFGADD
jgi:hypothetical protein